MVLTGIIVKGFSSFYYVDTGQETLECRLRGKLKQQKVSPVVGDRVRLDQLQPGKGVIEELLPRRNCLIRPSVANVDQILLVFASSNPEPQFSLLDRMLVLAEKEGVQPYICFNKADLVDPEQLATWTQIYTSIGYQVFAAQGKNKVGIEALQRLLTDRITVLAGPSGVGKSTLLNAIQPGLALKTGEVSTKLGRGKHTTRHVELLPLEFGGWVADTPGFSSLYLPDMTKEDLAQLFPEFDEHVATCRFNGCLHHKEPDCGVKTAIASGLVPQQRYETYLEFLAEVREQEDRRYD